MEFLFLYVEQFRGFYQQAFNFSPELKFSVVLKTETKKNKDYSVNIELNPDFVHLFDSNILNLTAIVGKNGAGKSTLLHCLKLITGQLGILTSSLIFAIREKKEKQRDRVKIYHYQGGGVDDMTLLNVTVNESLEVSKLYDVINPMGYKVERLGLNYNKEKVTGLDFSFMDVCSAYYSNIFDGHPEQYYEGLENLSTDYRVETFLKKVIQENVEEALNKKKETKIVPLFPSFIADYHKRERKLTLQFLTYATSRQLNRLPDLPNAVVIYFNFDDFKYLSSGFNSRWAQPKKLHQFQEIAVAAISQSEDKHENFINLTLLCTFYYVLRWNPKETKGLFEDNLDSALDRIIEEPERIFIHLKNLLANVNLASVELPTMNVVKHLLGKRFANSVRSMRFTSKEDYFQGSRARFEITIDNQLWPVLSAIDDLSSAEGSSFLEYEWFGGISTGEESIMLHYARLFELKAKVKKRPIWLLIDEGDIYYHPERQKMYLRDLLAVIKLLFGNNQIQIILTTHSPFIVSDLPIQNLIFMKKQDYRCTVVNEKIPIGTFGANIHDLFNETFFIENALMGDFAKDEIEKVINWCRSEGSLNQTEKIRRIINVIGEPIIKMKLMELFAKKIGQNTELARLQAQEAYIKDRISKITNQ
ncbi:AAA ATPase-like protein [Mucilaginibacter oryzae]|uniref:AAA ATPase-like protein n=1 Tax=Mucilaginibacter oryzae TaxID=468058 RepID=A0A316HC66_9SPHI|nr:AAA family ATPase [Mucilaginibacter oryzae]PWK68277.1 AAA ATPase-like protein [Mucilaginibacter oryzae]